MMNLQRVSIVIAALAISAAILAAANTLPLATHEELIVTPDRATETYNLTAGQKAVQDFRAAHDRLSGLVIYAPIPILTDQDISIRIADTTGALRAQAHSFKTAYLSDETLRLEYAFPTIDTEPNEHLLAEITLNHGSTLPLRVSHVNAYAGGSFTAPGNVQDRDMALATMRPGQLSFGARQGVLAGIALLLGVTLIASVILPRWQWLAAAVTIILTTPLALLGFWYSTGQLGISDWDLYFSYHEVVRQTVLEHGVFPQWNPYLCGGTAALADPEFPLFTFTFLLELIFGIPKGLRLAIFLSVAITGVGALALSRRLGLSVYAGLLAALGAAFGSVSLLEMVEGHPNVFSAMWIPWVFWAWLAAYRENPKSEAPNRKQITSKNTSRLKQYSASHMPAPWLRNNFTRFRVSKISEFLSFKPFRISNISNFEFRIWPLITGAFLALTFYAGGIYLLMYTTLAFILLPLLTSRPLKAYLTTIKAGLWAIGLAALKLIPVLFWLRQFPDDAYASSAFTLPWLGEILLGRHLHGSYIVFQQGSGWHEYGAYIGYVVFGLALIGTVRARHSRIVRALIIAAVAATLLSASGPALQPLFDQMPFFPRSNISRFILFATIPLSLLAGFGLDYLTAASRHRHKTKRTFLWPTILSISILALAAVDLMSLAYELSEQAFTLPRITRRLEPAKYPIAYTNERFDAKGAGTRETRSYEAILKGYGTFTYCSVLGPPPLVRTIHDEVDNDIVSVRPKTTHAQLTAWTPNQAEFTVQASEPTKISLNANYAKGWYVYTESDQGNQSSPALNDSGRVTAMIEPGTTGLRFRYQTSGLTAGLAVTLITLVLAGYVVHKRCRNVIHS